jgi:UDP:flavonoid glycosyltransferase YjiC (YdhE family)
MAPPPHALVIPYPAQGHVIPLLELAHALVDRGFTVTFANSEFNHHRVLAAMADGSAAAGLLDRIRLVAVPDGMEPGEDRNNLVRLTVLMADHMAPGVEDLIRRSHGETTTEDDGGPITCMVADYNLGTWALDVARRTGIKSAAIWPASAAVLASLLSINRLIHDKIIDANDGTLRD